MMTLRISIFLIATLASDFAALHVFDHVYGRGSVWPMGWIGTGALFAAIYAMLGSILSVAARR